ncbi:hypothetical protein Agub_g8816, partial [Astrephomene gubernaculifera]
MERLSKALAAVGKVGEAISRTAQSAQELLLDQDLRSKGIQTVFSGAQTRLQGIQNGIVQRAGRLVLDKQRQLQSLLLTLEERLSSSQRAQQLLASRRARVDVQFGRQLFADAPQEVRARLWYVLLENPHLAAPLKCEQPGPIPNRLSDDDEDVLGHLASAFNGCSLEALTLAAAADSDDGAVSDGRARARGSVVGLEAGGGGGGGGKFAAVAAAAFGLGGGRTSTGGSFSSSPSALSLGSHSRRERVTSTATTTTTADGPSGCLTTPQQPSGPPRSPSLAAMASQQQQQQAGGLATPLLGGRGGEPRASSCTPTAGAAGAGTSGAYEDPSDPDGWELVVGMGMGREQDGGAGGSCGGGGGGVAGSASCSSGAGGAGAAAQPEAFRLIMERLEALGPLPLDESGSDPVLVAQQAVLEAMLQVPWMAGVGLPADVAPDSRFAMLNEMTAGQEEVDESILRDIHRTFPEHPYFGGEAGQRALFRVLKAYSLHDLEVAYCQGMAFMAGVLLMYVPEEMAFRLFCRLMDAEGPNLRRLYLPGLEPLKAELATFEVLLSWRLPELAAHLSEFGLPPVLYVSQWLMTLFATPFPPPFCARVIDVLLQDGHDRLLLRCSYAVMEALEPQLLSRRDFEALITYLKMEPVSWGLHRQRAIMERALLSPITDEEIEVARETAANRQFLAAGEAAGEAGNTAYTSGSGGGGMAAAAPPPSVPAEAAAPATAAVHRGLTFEHEVEAALVAAAAVAATADDDEGAGGVGVGARERAAATGGKGKGCHSTGDDMISFEEEEGGQLQHSRQQCPSSTNGSNYNNNNIRQQHSVKNDRSSSSSLLDEPHDAPHRAGGSSTSGGGGGGGG